MMKKVTLLFIGMAFAACTGPQEVISSPDGNVQVSVGLTSKGAIQYAVDFNGKEVIGASTLGFDFAQAEDLLDGFELATVDVKEVSDAYTMQWGSNTELSYTHTEATFNFTHVPTGRTLGVVFRAANDGFAFRYLIPEQEEGQLVVKDEKSEFNLSEDAMAHWIPGDWEIYEHPYNHTKVSEIDALSKANHPNLAATVIVENSVSTPVTFEYKDGTHMSIHEAALVNYSGMTLLREGKTGFVSSLVGREDGNKATIPTPFKTPWRMVTLGDEATDLLASHLMYDLNEPNQMGDISQWFTPQKYVGIWWEMHMGKSTWDYGMTQDMGTWIDDGREHGRHGATNENTRRYIDFAAEHGFSGVLVEGWNTGWEHWIGFDDREGVFDFVTSYPDYDMAELQKYAKSKGVSLVMHHETSAAPRTYDQQMDTAYALMQANDIHLVKSGYVGPLLPKGEYHHGQWMVNHYNNAVTKAFDYQIAVNTHEPIKGTGLERTWPNWVAREGARGQEFNAWSIEKGNYVDHIPTMAFTRFLSGPMDYTPGVFQLETKSGPDGDNRVRSTVGQQFGLYVVVPSPIQMACDLPENYEKHLDWLQFIKDVAVDWERSIPVAGKVGQYVAWARTPKENDNWYLGAANADGAHQLSIALDFLEEGATYEAQIYRDADDADWETNPYAVTIETKTYVKGDSFDVRLASGGGFGAILVKQ
ncbi:MAG: glycoside hydrolase family 97 protein [Schleiferiaceae bacterium]